MDHALSSSGLNLLLSQTITDYAKFECGKKVPNVPDDPIFGGMQEFISNSFLKSALQYSIEKGFLDVNMTQEFWQSRAFQFRMGDIHDVMLGTKNISTMQEIQSRCNAMSD